MALERPFRLYEHRHTLGGLGWLEVAWGGLGWLGYAIQVLVNGGLEMSWGELGYAIQVLVY